MIKLMPSIGTSSASMKSHPEVEPLFNTQLGLERYAGSEICDSDERAVETQTLLFLKTCLLPLAMQTRALIIVSGANDCTLCTALSKVVVGEQARLGKDCPFTVISFALLEEVHAKAVSPDPTVKSSVVSQVARQSNAWKKRAPTMNAFFSKTVLPTDDALQECDLTECAGRFEPKY